MKKVKLLFYSSLFILSASVCHGQEGGNKRFSFGLGAGINMPVSNSIVLDGLNVINGAPKQTGYHLFEGYFSYNFNSCISATLFVGADKNNYQLTQPYVPNNNYTYEYTESGVSHSWQCLAGPSFRFPLCGKFSLEGKLSAGCAIVDNPSVTFNITATNPPPFGLATSGTYSFGNGLGWAYCIGTGIGYSICPALNLHLDINYTGSAINYKGYTESGYFDFYPGYSTLAVNAPAAFHTSALQVVAGCSVNF